MLIDDEKDIAVFLERYFVEKNFDVVVINDSEEAERRIIEEQPDLIFMDYRMSPITGKEILERLRLLKLQIPTIMMSAYKTMEGYYEMRKLGAVDYIAKPYDFKEIDRILEEHLPASP